MVNLKEKKLPWLCLCFEVLSLAAFAQGPDLVAQTGHSDHIQSVAFSPDGQVLASASFDDTIKLWDTSSGHELRTLLGHSGWALAVAFAPGGQVLASGSNDNTIKFWDVASGRELRTFSGEAEISNLAFSPDGRLLASGGADRIKLWDVASGNKLPTPFTRNSEILSLAFSPNGKILAAAYEDNTIELWDMRKAEIQTLSGHEHKVMSVAFTPNGRTLVSASLDKTIRFWDVARGTQVRSLSDGESEFHCIAMSPDGRLLASGGYGTDVTIWDMASGHPSRTLPTDSVANIVNSLAFSSDGRTLASGDLNKAIHLWDIPNGYRLRKLPSHSTAIGSVALSADGRTLASGGQDGVIRFWDLADGSEQRTVPGHSAWSWQNGDRTQIVSGWVTTLSFSPDGQTLASGSTDKTVKLWDLVNGVELRTLDQMRSLDPRAGGFVFAIRFSPNGKKLASGDFNGDTKIWDVATGNELQHLKGPSLEIRSLAFSPDGDMLASGYGDGTITLWNTATGLELRTIHPHFTRVLALAFTSDGHTLASGDEQGMIKLSDVSNGTELRPLLGNNAAILSLSLGHDPGVLISGSKDETIKFWDIATGKELTTLVLSRHVTGCDVMVIGERNIVSADVWGAVRMRDTGSGKELVTLYALEKNDWLITDPQARFDTNNLDEILGLSWIFPDDPLRALPPEIFMRDYYQPKLLSRTLKSEPMPAVRSISNLNRTQPVAELLRVEPEQGGEFVSVTARVSSTRSKAQKDAAGNYMESGAFDLRLFRDGQLVAEWPEVSQAAVVSSDTSGPRNPFESWRKQHTITLVKGDCTHTFHHIRLPHRTGVDKVQFTAYVFNDDRVKSLTTPALEYSLPKSANTPPVAASRRAYLITMGVNANQSQWNLDFAVPSAQHAARLLHDKLAGQYEVIDVSLFSTLASDSPRVVLDQATKSNLKAVLDLLAGRPVDDSLRNIVDAQRKIQPATPDDAVILFISSHGYADPQGVFYVVPYDTGPSLGVTEDLLSRCLSHPDDRSAGCQKAIAFLQQTISSEDFSTWWSGVDAGEMVMILDSCHSAALPGRQFRPGPLGDAGFGQLSYDKGMSILSATQPDKTARATFLQQLGHSLLVEALVQESKTHGQETLAEWLRSTKREVPALTHQLYPELTDAEIQLPEFFDFAIAERYQGKAHPDDAAQ